ncbi:MAG: OmpA family protein [Cyclobacteriaceae bacterium]
MKKATILILIALPLISFGQTDNPECVDKLYTFFTKMDGYYISDCEESEFNEYGFWIKSGSEKVVKQGHFKKIWFNKDANSTRKISGLQILTNHSNAIKKIGGQVLEGTKNVFKASYKGKEIWFELSPTGTSPDEGAWYIVSVEVETMKQEITALDMDAAIKSDGKIALYGILFETGKASITPESAKAVEEVGTYLKNNPAVSIFVVGHTDNVGDYQMNMKLSKSRAEAVKNELVNKYGIEPSRLIAEGIGQLSPISSNETEEGRALNRRVEIVKK